MNLKNNKKFYESIPEGYYDQIFESNSGPQSKWHQLKFRKVNSIINEISPNTILDVACGPGTFLGQLQKKKNCEYYGADIAKNQIDYANKKYSSNNLKFIESKDALFPFEDNKFDLVTGLEFIEHITPESLSNNLSEIKRCLKKNGYLILTTPNYQSLWPILEFVVSKITSQNYIEQHISKFNGKSLLQKLENENFSNIKVESYLWLSPFFSIISDKLSDLIYNFEIKNLRKFGNLLVVVCQNVK